MKAYSALAACSISILAWALSLLTTELRVALGDRAFFPWSRLWELVALAAILVVAPLCLLRLRARNAFSIFLPVVLGVLGFTWFFFNYLIARQI